jgi:Methane oxygenase PmoA
VPGDRVPLLSDGWECVDSAGSVYPAQITGLSGGSHLFGVYVERLDANRELSLDFRPVAAADFNRGIELHDLPENGRIIVNYSGFLQTIYHYGRENFKPRFYPLTAPCARMGDIDGEQTVYPKSITDDSPPDHIWHRSLWYACGDLNGADFYLENGGEGRIVHKEFADVFSGPLFGGFRERLRWTAPDGREMLDDERAFLMYRLKGQLRVFDLEAAFTALGEPVTFGQTNENALPLIRVADIIDEWDGGTITLADGTSGGKACFGARSPWADCSGPLVRRGSVREVYGIAMLDHPSNRNHPNAWFARSYGPLGTNLPFFDGALTLQPGDTWRLKHRIIIHAGDAWQAGIPERFAEYANPAEISVTEGEAS